MRQNWLLATTQVYVLGLCMPEIDLLNIGVFVGAPVPGQVVESCAKTRGQVGGGGRGELAGLVGGGGHRRTSGDRYFFFNFVSGQLAGAGRVPLAGQQSCFFVKT